MQCAPLIFEYTYASTCYTTCVSKSLASHCAAHSKTGAVYTPISTGMIGVAGWAGSSAKGVASEARGAAIAIESFDEKPFLHH